MWDEKHSSLEFRTAYTRLHLTVRLTRAASAPQDMPQRVAPRKRPRVLAEGGANAGRPRELRSQSPAPAVGVVGAAPQRHSATGAWSHGVGAQPACGQRDGSRILSAARRARPLHARRASALRIPTRPSWLPSFSPAGSSPVSPSSSSPPPRARSRRAARWPRAPISRPPPRLPPRGAGPTRPRRSGLGSARATSRSVTGS